MRKVLGISVAALAALAVVAGPANAAEGEIVGAGVPNAVHDSYIVVLKNGSTTQAGGLAGKFGGRLGYVYPAVNGFSVEVSERQAKRLAADPSVAYVEQNQTLSATAVQPNPPSWGLDRIDQRQLPLNSSYSYTTTASNVNVYVLDTGVRATHQTFGGRVRQGYDSVASGVTWVVAAGNSNADAGGFSPARVREAITVGATDRTDTRASYSNYGSVLDLFAPGSGITSAWNTNNTATYTGNGTSFASPHVAGAAALYLSANTAANPAQVSAALVAKATAGIVKNPGAGSPNRLLYTGPQVITR